MHEQSINILQSALDDLTVIESLEGEEKHKGLVALFASLDNERLASSYIVIVEELLYLAINKQEPSNIILQLVRQFLEMALSAIVDGKEVV
ncbi:hypothetical protein [Flammeovirga aprica]|uniref:Uncharacterized protein n=1 Tax=Flammeovirga aprica JL-4 TaxID=694437 RepID=A0A7X9P072_9BACT|nr:hypothetical protein [Flammeovirga aprica]NME66607.1 hypothetical protein [Flammeovirga aprica JL-4]